MWSKLSFLPPFLSLPVFFLILILDQEIILLLISCSPQTFCGDFLMESGLADQLVCSLQKNT